MIADVATFTFRNGLFAARGAGVRFVVTPSVYSQGEDLSEASLMASDLELVTLATLKVLLG